MQGQAVNRPIKGQVNRGFLASKLFSPTYAVPCAAGIPFNTAHHTLPGHV